MIKKMKSDMLILNNKKLQSDKTIKTAFPKLDFYVNFAIIAN